LPSGVGGEAVAGGDARALPGPRCPSFSMPFLFCLFFPLCSRPSFLFVLPCSSCPVLVLPGARPATALAHTRGKKNARPKHTPRAAFSFEMP
jgi:hypothetical protein